MSNEAAQWRHVFWIRAVTLGGIVLAWEALARSGLLYQDVVPPLESIIRVLIGEVTSARLYANAWVTLMEVIVGMVIATILGVAGGILFGARPFLGRAVEPTLNALATTPKIIFLPIVMLAMGIGVESKIVLGVLSAFFPISISTTAGVRDMRRIYVLVGRMYNLNTWQMVTKIYIPALVNPIVTGMRLGLGVCIIGVLLGEIKLSNAGLGFLAIDYYSMFRIPELYAVLIIIFVLAVGANSLMSRATRRSVARD